VAVRNEGAELRGKLKGMQQSCSHAVKWSWTCQVPPMAEVYVTVLMSPKGRDAMSREQMRMHVFGRTKWGKTENTTRSWHTPDDTTRSSEGMAKVKIVAIRVVLVPYLDYRGEKKERGSERRR